MTEPITWLALGYNIPINPSKNRVYIWRKLKEYGAEYFKQGVALLPNNKTNLTRFAYLASKIREIGGEASIVEMKFIDYSDEMEIVERFKKQTASELDELKDDCFSLLKALKLHTDQRISEYESDQLKKMVKRFSKAKSRDHFGCSESDDVEKGIN
ncbi:MAG: hypothetical protein RRZ73_00755, partial [Oscillospiraceae bacterium]